MGCCSSPRSTLAGVGILHLMVALGCMGLCGYLLTLDGASLEMVLMDSWSLLTTMHLTVVVDTEGNVIDREKAMVARDRGLVYRTNDSKRLNIHGRSTQDIENISVLDDEFVGRVDVSENRNTTIDSVSNGASYADYDNVNTSIEFDDVTVLNSISNESSSEDLTLENGSENSYNVTKIGVRIENATESAFNFIEYLNISTNREDARAESISATLVNGTLSPEDEIIVNATKLSEVDHELNSISPNLMSSLDLRGLATSNETTDGVTEASSTDTVMIRTSFDEDNDTVVATRINVSTVRSDALSDYTSNDVDYISVLYVEEPQHKVTEINGSNEELEHNVTGINSSDEELQLNVTEINLSNEEPQHNVTEIWSGNEEPQLNVTEINSSNEEPQYNVTEIRLSYEEPQHNVTEINLSSEESQHNVAEINFSNEKNGSMIELREGRPLSEDEIQYNVDGHFEQKGTEQTITTLQTTLAESQTVGRNVSLPDAVVVASSTHSLSVKNTSLAETLLFEEVVLQQQATSSDQLEPPLVVITTTPPPVEETPANISAVEGIAFTATYFPSADDDDESNASMASTEDETAAEPSPSTEESRPDVGASEEAEPNASVLTTDMSTNEEAAPNVSALATVVSTTEEAASNVGALATVLPTPMEESANVGALTTVLSTPEETTSNVGALATVLPTPTEKSANVGALTTVLPTSDAFTALVGSSGFLSTIASALATSVLDSTTETSPSRSHSTPSSPTTLSNVSDPETLPLPTLSSPSPVGTSGSTRPSSNDLSQSENVTELAEPLPSASALMIENDASLSPEVSRPDVGALTAALTTSEEAALNASVLAGVTSTHEEAAPNVSALATILSAPEEAAFNVGVLATVLPTPMEESDNVGALTTVLPTKDVFAALVGSSGFMSTITSVLATSVLDSTTETSPSRSHSTPSSPTALFNVSDPETLPSPTLSSLSPVGTWGSTPPSSSDASPSVNVTELAEPLPSASALRMENDARYSLLTNNGSYSVPYVNGDVRDVNTTVEGITLPPIITSTGFITTILVNTVTDSGSKADAELAHLERQLKLGLAVLTVLWFAIVCTIASLLLLVAAAVRMPALVVPWLVVQWVSVLAAIAGVGILTWRLVVAGVVLWCWWLVVLSVAGVVVLVLCLVLVMEAHQTMPSNAARQQDYADSYEMRYITEK